MSRNNTPRGFTLFELMVTISLVVLLLTLSSLSYRNANKRTELVLTAHQVGAMGRLAESYAASAKEFDATTSGENVWGLYFDITDSTKAKKIIMFVDKKINGQSVGNQTYDVGEEVKTLDLPRQIAVNMIKKPDPSDPTSWISAEQAVVLFTPPDPKTKLWCNIGNTWISTDILRVVLKDDANQSVKDIRFNFFGLIDVRL